MKNDYFVLLLAILSCLFPLRLYYSNTTFLKQIAFVTQHYDREYLSVGTYNMLFMTIVNLKHILWAYLCLNNAL